MKFNNTINTKNLTQKSNLIMKNIMTEEDIDMLFKKSNKSKTKTKT